MLIANHSKRDEEDGNINNIVAQAHERANNNVAHHQSWHTTITTYYHLPAMNIVGKGWGELDDVKGIQRIARTSTDGAVDSWYGFDECRIGYKCVLYIVDMVGCVFILLRCCFDTWYDTPWVSCLSVPWSICQRKRHWEIAGRRQSAAWSYQWSANGSR